MPDPTNTPSGPVATDPLLGISQPVYAGGDELSVDVPEGDRGDDFVGDGEDHTPPAKSQVPEPQVPERERDPETGRFVPKPKEAEGEDNAGVVSDENNSEVVGDQETQGEGTQGEGTQGEADEAMVPKARLQREIDKRRDLERRLAEREAAERAESEAAQGKYDFDAAEERYMNAVLDGKTEEAKAIRSEIRKAEKAEYERLAEQRAETVTTKVDTKKALLDVAARYETDYPVFDPESESFNEELLDEAQAIYRGYIETGRYASPVDAFQKALDVVVKSNDLQKAGQPAPAAGKKQPAPAPARTATKRVEAIASQPPVTGTAGRSSASAGEHALNPLELTDDEIAKLPIATLKRLRGDEL